MAALKAIDAERQARNLGAAGSDEAAEGKDLARVEVEADPFDGGAASHITRREQWDAASVRLDPAAGFRALDVMTDDRADEPPLVQPATGRPLCDLAVAEDGDAIAEVEHLIEPMRDIEDRDAARREVAYDRKQLLAFRTRQRRRWLVHRDQRGFPNERLADHDEPALAH